MPNYAEINHASAEISAELGMLNFGSIFGNAEMLCLEGDGRASEPAWRAPEPGGRP